jgi:hypothetical protein
MAAREVGQRRVVFLELRQRAMYCITGSPTRAVKRAESAERDIATSAASEARVHGRAGSRWMSASARPICLSCSAPIHPVCAAGSCAIQLRIAWITRMSASRVMMVSPPGSRVRASEVISRRLCCIHSCCPALVASKQSSLGSSRTSRSAAG